MYYQTVFECVTDYGDNNGLPCIAVVSMNVFYKYLHHEECARHGQCLVCVEWSIQGLMGLGLLQL